MDRFPVVSGVRLVYFDVNSDVSPRGIINYCNIRLVWPVVISQMYRSLTSPLHSWKILGEIGLELRFKIPTPSDFSSPVWEYYASLWWIEDTRVVVP